jgi:Fe-S oxidoreductase
VNVLKERIKGRKNYPTEEVDSLNFLNDKEVKDLIEKKDLKFSQKDFIKLYNCVHCGECDSEKERFLLKQRFIEDGNTFEGHEEMIENFNTYRSPYRSNKMRIRMPEDIPKSSDTLFFMGCLSTIRIPRYTEHALQFLLKENIDFTILDTEICCGWHLLASGLKNEFETCKKENVEIFNNYKNILCLCPACFYLFNVTYRPELNENVKVTYIADYLKASKTKKTGKIGIQHLCQLKNRGTEGVDKFVESLLKKSGYDVANITHWCCGGGSGWMGRTENIEAIARKRMTDFDREDLDYATTYCPSCWWILERFSKKCKIKPKAKDIFELLL